MKSKLLLMVALAGVGGSAAHALPNPTDVIPAKGGAIKITPIYHASFQIEYRNRVIQIDPFSGGDYSGAKKPDFILVTHSHPDHLDVKAIERLFFSGEEEENRGFITEVQIYCPRDVAKQLKPLEVDNEGRLEIKRFDADNGGSSIGIDEHFSIGLDQVPAYNIKRGPKPGAKYHTEGKCNGYVLTIGGKRIYIAGDTEVTPEMKALKNIDIAFLPMNLPFTMTPQEAAAGAKAFKPKIVYPYHFRYPFDKANTNPQQFTEALKGSGIEVRVRGWYAHPAKKG